jgi:hypothetical protein
MEYEEGDRVAWMRVAPLTGDIQIVPARVLGMIDDYRALIQFGGGQELAISVDDLTPMPKQRPKD